MSAYIYKIVLIRLCKEYIQEVLGIHEGCGFLGAWLELGTGPTHSQAVNGGKRLGSAWLELDAGLTHSHPANDRFNLYQHGSCSNEDRHTHILQTLGDDFNQHGSSATRDQHTHILRTMGNDLYQHGSCLNEDRHTHVLRMLGAGSEHKTLRLWDLKTGVVLKRMEGHHSEVLELAVSRVGNLIASGDSRGERTL
ncbi:uncharacterized protein F5891DRAFT_1207546 [Suillus fuscotomentosus]|uniref:Uncharacterized protein n=1 Tax=Suillus fuscotomentosus TaxID=1912939 RepID=A0AAD4HE85_9AGAM|nr:uncharacterized protein F5891DRAFT_1207546 [Suillus fuscotomentosus]KAG1893353.1 hypothetical protein F5891DRAFT_1207546 [Suillus fuscotomentosus]